jgi:L-threonylcarbamoyladenylate synthase
MSDLIGKALEVLRAGGLVAIPTETVYGLAADASNPEAVEKIFSTKGRPSGHPLIVHIAYPPSSDQLSDDAWRELLLPWVRDISPAALALAKAFWPGPLTIILPKAKNVLSQVTGGQDTVGIRCPKHPVAQDLLVHFGGGLAAPSANRFGRISPTSAEHVREEFVDQPIMVLDGGPCEVGIESTIVDLSRWDQLGYVILRPGAISGEMIQAALLDAQVEMPHQISQQSDINQPRVSGSLSAHYAPKTKMFLYATGHLSAVLPSALKLKNRLAWVHFSSNSAADAEYLKTQHMNVVEKIIPAQSGELARLLYALLRQLDQEDYDGIAFEDLPSDAAWDAVRDRLGRAVVGSGS